MALRRTQDSAQPSHRTPAPSIVAALRAHRVRQLEERLGARRWEDWGLVFCSEVGTPLDTKNVTHRLQRLVKRHDLRHACASLLLAQGVHPRVVMEILGHSEIGTTMKIYSHVIPTLQRDVASLMDRLLVPLPTTAEEAAIATPGAL